MNTDNLCMGCMKICEEDVCPLCGFSKTDKNPKGKLPVRFVLGGRYTVGKLLSTTCEGNVYMGYDTAFETAVHIKEYCPDGITVRNPDKTVSTIESMEYAFNDGLISFLELNKKLMTLDLSALSKTRSVFEENGTVYAVTEAVEGVTLKKYIEDNGGQLPWEQARPLFLPLIDTLISLHEQDIFHCGISPESVFVTSEGTLHISDILINRVRRADNDLTAQIYSGYAAVEQYSADGTPLGAYTDVYGVSATLFRTLIGVIPPDANERVNNDTLSIPAHFAEELPRQVLVALANGLQVLPEKRSATVEKFRDELVYGETRENLKKAAKRKAEKDMADGKAVKIDDEDEIASDSKKSGVKTWLVAVLCTVGVFAVIAAILIFVVFKDQIFPQKKPTASSSEESMPSVASIGEYDSSAVNSKVEYTVPSVCGKYFADLTEQADSDELKHFTFKVTGKSFSETYEKGMICTQSVGAGSKVENDTEISVTISLGPQNFKLINVSGQTELEAKISLLSQGILFKNIEVVEKFDSAGKPGVVLEQTPAGGENVTAETRVKIYVNSYKGETESSDSSTQDDDDI